MSSEGALKMSELPTSISNFYRVFNTGKTTELDSILDHNWVNHPNDSGHSADIIGFKAGIIDFRETFDKFELKIIHSIQDDDNIAIHIQMTGRQIRSFAGILPTKRTVTFYGLDRHLLNKDHTKIIETWHFEDFSNLIKGESKNGFY